MPDLYAITKAETGHFAACLPWPPSANSYWQHRVAGIKARRPHVQTFIGKKGVMYRANLQTLLADLGRPLETMTGRLAVTIEGQPPDRRARDLDNILKSLLDALECLGSSRMTTRLIS